VVVASTIAPLWINQFTKRPRLGIIAWLSLFLSAGLASLIAIAISIWAVIYNFITLEQHKQNLFLTLAFSIAPWLIFAMAGIAINLINLKLEPIIANFKKLFSQPVLPAKTFREFQGVDVQLIELDVPIALAISRPAQKILISAGAVARLSDSELDAALWHEIGHLRGRHNFIKRVVRLVDSLAPFIRASKVMSHEVDRLCEVAADNFALRHVDARTLHLARAVFS
jgi:Zn-dependent protease with chaperone function